MAPHGCPEHRRARIRCHAPISRAVAIRSWRSDHVLPDMLALLRQEFGAVVSAAFDGMRLTL
jgi:hypothetical protein